MDVLKPAEQRLSVLDHTAACATTNQFQSHPMMAQGWRDLPLAWDTAAYRASNRANRRYPGIQQGSAYPTSERYGQVDPTLTFLRRVADHWPFPHICSLKTKRQLTMRNGPPRLAVKRLNERRTLLVLTHRPNIHWRRVFSATHQDIRRSVPKCDDFMCIRAHWDTKCSSQSEVG